MTDRPLVFDAYGTLFDPLALSRRLEAAFPGRGPAISTAWRATQQRYTWLTSLMGRWTPFDALTADALRFACAAHGVTATDALVDELMASYARLPLYPDAAAALGALPGPALILSNGTAPMLAATVAAAGIDDRISAILSSDAVRIYKPSPRIYALATDHLGVAPSSVTFVSGNGWDCAGAAACGFDVVRVARGASAEPDERLGTPGLRRVAGLDALPTLLSDGGV